MSEGWHPVETVRIYHKGDVVEFEGQDYKVVGRSTRQICIVKLRWWDRLRLKLTSLLTRK